MIRATALLLASMEVTALVSFAADVKGLKEQTKITVTDQMIGLPLAGYRPASVWAVAFSPDDQYFAVGVEFTKTKSSSAPIEDDRSYLLILQMNDFGGVLRRFEKPRHPAMRVYPPLRWTSDGRYVATPFYTDWQHVAVAEISSGKLTIVPNQRCRLEGLLPGPQVVQSCTTPGSDSAIRFAGPGGETLKEWRFPERITILGVESKLGRIAVAKRGGADTRAKTHEIAVLDANDRSEIRHWSFAGEVPYFGSFAESGSALCVMEASANPDGTDLVCLSVLSGAESLRLTLPAGWSTLMISGGGLVGIEHRDIKKVPRFLQSLAQTSVVMTNPARCIWDLPSARETAELPIRTQWVLPGVDAPYAWTISPTGDLVAEGGSGAVTIYRVAGAENPQPSR